MPGPAVSCVDIAGIASMRIGKCAPQSILIRRHDDDVDMIGHQAISPDLRLRALCRLREQIAVKSIIGIFKKSLLPTIAALGDMIGNAGITRRGSRAIFWDLHNKCIQQTGTVIPIDEFAKENADRTLDNAVSVTSAIFWEQ